MAKMKWNKKIFAAALALVLTASAVIPSAISVSAETLPDSSTPEYTAYICDTDNGTAAFTDPGDGTTEMVFHEGDTVKVETSADEGYEFSDAYITGVEDASGLDYNEKDGTVSFTMPDRDILVYVDFQKTGGSDVSEEDGWQDDAGLDDSAGDGTVIPEGTKIISSFTMDCDLYAVPRGEYEFDEIVEMLPGRIEAVLSDGTEDTVEIAEWTCSNREMLDAETEDDVTLCFTGKLPEGYMLDSSDPELRPPGVMLRVMDPYGISLMADTTKYLDKGGIIYYGGYNTHRYVYGGREAYCANPSKSSPRSGNYSASVISDYGNASAIWFAYGSPGFDAGLYPSTWYDGSAMTPDKYRALSHIIISDRFSGDASYAYGQCTASFRSWVQNYVIGYSASTGAVVNTSALKYKIDHYQFGAGGGANTWPEGFTAYTIYTGNSSQSMVSFDYTPSNPPSPVYQVTNYNCRQGFVPSMDLYIQKSDCETGEKLADAVFDVYMDGEKVSSVTTDSSGMAAYHWRGSTVNTAYFQSRTYSFCVNYDELSSTDKAKVNANPAVYNYKSTAYAAAKAESVNAANAALETLKTDTEHTWKVVETKAPDGYSLNEEIFEETLDATVTAIEIDFTDVSDGGYLKLQKSSGNTELTDGNDCYSLEGAEYGVYEKETDAKNDRNRIATLTTDVDGNTEVIEIGAGKWFVKEVKASDGYKLCDGSDDADESGIHTITVTTDNTEDNPAIVECVEPPVNDPFALTLQKLDAETGETAQGTASFEGAIFALEYYTNTDGDTSGEPFKTWYFQTDEDGNLNCNNSKYLLSSYTMNNGTQLVSSELYIDSDNTEVVYPVGTYHIYEVSPPVHYQLSGYMQFKQNASGKTDVNTGLKAVIKQDENGGDACIYDGDNIIDGRITAENLAINIYDEVENGSITIYKQKSDGSKDPLSGVTFKLVGLEEGDEYTATTDQDGKVIWEDLIPQDYVITEVSTVDGYNLLKDNIEVTLPIEMTFEEIRKNGADISQAVYDEAAGKYCFYDVTLTVGNTVTFDVPFTGSMGNKKLYVYLIIGLAALSAGILFGFQKKKSPEKTSREGNSSKKE